MHDNNTTKSDQHPVSLAQTMICNPLGTTAFKTEKQLVNQCHNIFKTISVTWKASVNMLEQ